MVDQTSEHAFMRSLGFEPACASSFQSSATQLRQVHSDMNRLQDQLQRNNHTTSLTNDVRSLGIKPESASSFQASASELGQVHRELSYLQDQLQISTHITTADDAELSLAIDASKHDLLQYEDVELSRAIDASKHDMHEELELQRAIDASIQVEREKQAKHSRDVEYLEQVRLVESRSQIDAPLPLAMMMGNLRKKHPSLVNEIKYMAGATQKFEYLRACLLEEDGKNGGFEGKLKVQAIYEKLSAEDKQDLERAYHLADGERNAFILEIVTEDRRQRQKLGLHFTCPKKTCADSTSSGGYVLDAHPQNGGVDSSGRADLTSSQSAPQTPNLRSWVSRRRNDAAEQRLLSHARCPQV